MAADAEGTCRPLRSLAQLRSLDLSENASLGDEGCVAVSHILSACTLRCIKLRSCDVGPIGLTALRDAIVGQPSSPNGQDKGGGACCALEELDLAHNPRIATATPIVIGELTASGGDI